MASIHCAYSWQALAAATNTVESTKIVHNLHSYFLLVGDITSKDIIISLVILLSSKQFLFPSLLHITIPAVNSCSSHHIWSQPLTWWQQLCLPKSRCKTERENHIHLVCIISGLIFVYSTKYFIIRLLLYVVMRIDFQALTSSFLWFYREINKASITKSRTCLICHLLKR